MHRQGFTTKTIKRTRNEGKGRRIQQQSMVLIPKRNQRSLLFDDRASLSPELKNIDTIISGLSVPVATIFTIPRLLNGLAPGTGSNQRVGRKTVAKSIFLRMNMSGSNVGPSQTRVVIFYDRQTNGVAPIALDVIQTETFVGLAQMANSERFLILMDEITDSRQSSALNISLKRYIKCKLETIFTGTAGTVADIITGGIFIMFANNADATIGATTVVDYQARVRYIDN